MTTSAEPVGRGPLAAAPAVHPAHAAALRLPGGYRPQEVTALLAEAIGDPAVPDGARALDLGTGAGARAITLARSGAAGVATVDLSRRALVSLRFNAFRCRAAIRPRRGNLATAWSEGLLDVVVANPPYVSSAARAVRNSRGWDTGPDGRAVPDPLRAAASMLPRPGGTLLFVQSGPADVGRSVARPASHGLRVSVARREPGERAAEPVVLRADR